MSGYLGRMLRSTVRNEHRLRPLAGSIFGEKGGERGNALTFAGDEGAGGVVKPGEEQEFRETEQPVIPRGSSGRNAKARPEEPMASLGNDWLDRYEPFHPPERETRRSALAAPGDSLHAYRKTSDEHHSARGIQPSGEEVRTAAQPGAESEPTRTRPATAPSELHALSAKTLADPMMRDATTIRETAQARGELISQRAVQPTVTAREQVQAAQRQSGRFDGAPRHAAPETPDVQVHIGRIEVLAVQPQAPSAAPTPRRSRTTSLADYLAGRNGR